MSAVDENCEYVLNPDDPKTWGGEEDDECYIDEENLNEQGVWTCPHEAKKTVEEEEGEKDLCLFHLPPEEKDDDEVVAAFLDVLEQAASGNDPDTQRRKQQFIGVTFGPFNVSGKTLSGGDETPINLRHARFTGASGDSARVAWEISGWTFLGTGFEAATFEGDVYFEGATFEAQTYFEAATFEGDVYFEGETFEAQAYFKDTVFKNNALFSGVVFRDTVSFTGAIFKNEADFKDVFFKAGASFSEVTFKDGASFLGATFEGTAYFSDAIFEDKASFWEMTFGGRADFKDVTFKDEVNFEGFVGIEGAAFEGQACFEGAVFKHVAGFANVTFEDAAKFGNTIFEENAILKEDATLEGAARFGNATFEGQADFESAAFKDGAGFAGVTFEDAANFRDACFEEGLTWEGAAYFIGVAFEGRTEFNNAVFAQARFTNAIFEDEVYFRTNLSDRWFPISMFQGPADFSGVSARDTIDFRVTYDDRPLSSKLLTFIDKADFTDASLAEGCKFEGTSFGQPPTFKRADLEGADCQDAEFDGADFSNANLTDVTFRHSSLQAADLETARLSRTNLTGTDLRGAALAETVLTDARIDDTTRFLEPPVDDLPAGAYFPWSIASVLPGVTPAIPACGYDPVFTPPDDRNDDINWPEQKLNKAKSVYRAIENLAGLSSRPRLQSRAFVRRQDIQRKQYQRAATEAELGLEWLINRGRWIRGGVARMMLHYGESPWRIIGWSLTVVLLFAVLYPLGGWMRPTVCPSIEAPECPPLRYGDVLAAPGQAFFRFGQSVYYSTLTFTTLGFGDFRPDGFGQALTTVETALGAVLIALLVFVLGRRATR